MKPAAVLEILSERLIGFATLPSRPGLFRPAQRYRALRIGHEVKAFSTRKFC
jgi:hypothetical protein